jgi:hypothetical protein
MDLPTERKKLLRELFQAQTGIEDTKYPEVQYELGDMYSGEPEGYRPEYIEYLEKNLYSFIRTECNLNFINRLIKEIALMEESAKEHEFIFKERQMISSSMCSAAMATAYRLVIDKLKKEKRLQENTRITTR